jgi:putative spermidine/putrescine transport system permease protein
MGEGGGGGLTWAHYRDLVVDPGYRQALLNSLVLSLSVAFFSVFICLAPAWVFATREFRGKALLRAIYALPMSFSGILVGFLMILLLGRIGFLPQILERLTGRAFFSGLAYQFGGLMLAYIYFEIPRATLSLESALRKFDLRLDLAARTLGANRWQRLVWVMLPALRPALLSTLAVAFSASLGSFGVALILSRRFTLLPVEIYRQFTGYVNLEAAAAMSMVLVLTAVIVNFTLRGWQRVDGRLHA